MAVGHPLVVGDPQSVGWSASSVSLFGANSGAKFRSVFNDCDKPCYILFNGTAASATLFTVKLAAGVFFVFPDPVYNNQVNIIWDAAGTGSARTMQY